MKPGSPTLPVPGYDIRVLGDDGARGRRRSRSASIVIKLPLPPGALPTLWHNDDGFKKSYLVQHPGLLPDRRRRLPRRRRLLLRDEPHRRHHQRRRAIGCRPAAIEEVLAGHPDVAECAVIGAADEMKGEVPVGFVVLKAGVTRAHDDSRRPNSSSACAATSARLRASRPRWS